MPENMHPVCFSYPEELSRKQGRNSHTYAHGACPSAVTRAQICAVKAPGDVLSTAACQALVTWQQYCTVGVMEGLSGKCSSRLGCLGDTHGGPCLVDQQLHSGKQKDSETKES